MIGLIKSWISMMVILGIAFTLIRMITPNTNLKKYIESIIGVVSILTILTPIISMLNNDNVTESISNSISELLTVETMSKDYNEYVEKNTSNVISDFENRIEADIKKKIKEKINQEVIVNVKVNNAYSIEKINVLLKKSTDFNIKHFISNEYDITEDKIEVSKGG